MKKKRFESDSYFASKIGQTWVVQKPPSFLSLSFESGLDGNGNITLQSTWWFYPSASFPPFSAFSRHLHRAWFIFKPTRWFFRFFMTLVFFFTFAWFLSSFLSHPCSSHRLPQTTMTTIKLDSSSGAWVSTVVDSLARFIPLWDDNFFSCYQRNAFHGAPSTKWSWLNRFVFSWCCHVVWCHRKKWHAIKALRLVLSIQINYDVKSFFFFLMRWQVPQTAA